MGLDACTCESRWKAAATGTAQHGGEQGLLRDTARRKESFIFYFFSPQQLPISDIPDSRSSGHSLSYCCAIDAVDMPDPAPFFLLRNRFIYNNYTKSPL